MRGQAPFWIDPNDSSFRFPHAELALSEPDGLLAVGGSLHPQRLLSAYPNGIFPWYNKDQPILWWSPDPRAVLYPQHLKVSRSLRKVIKKAKFHVTADREFEQVMVQCAQPRGTEPGTWITPEMLYAYLQLHQMGYAHSIECWHEEKLVGGLYGIAIGKVFFGESMFSCMDNVFKVALYHLTQYLIDRDFQLIDCQVSSPHLMSLGSELIPRQQFLQHLDQFCSAPTHARTWQADLLDCNLDDNHG